MHLELERERRLQREIEKEHEREKRETRLVELEIQKAQIEANRAINQPVNNFPPMGFNNIKIPPFNEDDVEGSFSVFERAALAMRWPRDSWIVHLGGELTGKAFEVYKSFPLADYDFNLKKKF